MYIVSLAASLSKLLQQPVKSVEALRADCLPRRQHYPRTFQTH